MMIKIVSISFLIVSIFGFIITSHSIMDIKSTDKEISYNNFYKLLPINDNLMVFAQNNSKSPIENKSNNENMSVKSSILLNNITNIQAPKSTTSSTNNNTYVLKNNISNKTQPENHSASSLPTSKTVIIVKGAALLRDQAFSPNPIKIHAKDSINWINKDDVVHTVTSGASFNSPDRGQEFDSGMLGGSYIHKFEKPGEYNYFCQIHPTMIGKIIVQK